MLDPALLLVVSCMLQVCYGIVSVNTMPPPSVTNNSSTVVTVLPTLYHYCCRQENLGKPLLTTTNRDQLQVIFCPSVIPVECSTLCNYIRITSGNGSLTPSGFYTVSPTDEFGTVYCDMMGKGYCDGEGGWTKVVDIRMNQTGASCPLGWGKLAFNNVPHPLCGVRNHLVSSCDSAHFLLSSFTLSGSISKICGRLKGYQFGTTTAFTGEPSLDSVYLDGVSITIGSPRRHLWSYSSGWRNSCPCNTNSFNNLPSFVNEHYYCETAEVGNNVKSRVYYNDPLWDGAQCDYNEFTDETMCCNGSSGGILPWFYRHFEGGVDVDDQLLELRICNSKYANTLIEVAEIYVK